MSNTTNHNLIFYHFFQKDLVYTWNFCHFFEFGYQDDIDYVIIISGDHSFDLPQSPNIRYIFTENKNNDYGGYCTALDQITNIDDYEYFFFINSSVRGPFNTSLANSKRLWTDAFIDLLDDDTGLVGSTINILPATSAESKHYQTKNGGTPPYSHVQTTAYALKRETLKQLLTSGFFDDQAVLSKEGVVAHYELGLSQKVIKLGLNLKCLLPEYNQIDYRKPHKEINPTSVNGDVIFRNAYFGRTLHPYEAMFIKTNRSLYLESYLDRLAASAYVAKGGANGLRSRELDAYRESLELAHISNERVAFQGMQFKPEQILNLTKQLIDQHPQSAKLIAELVKAQTGKR